MKYFLIISFILIYSVTVFASDFAEKEVAILDSLLLIASENESGLEALVEYIDKLTTKKEFNKSPLLLSYRGIAEAVKGKYAFWPFTKLSYLNDGLELMNEAVTKDSLNIKIRYMRFTVLNSLPGIVGHSSFADSEANKLYTQLVEMNNSDSKLYNSIASLLVKSERLNDNQVDELLKYYIVEKQWVLI